MPDKKKKGPIEESYGSLDEELFNLLRFPKGVSNIGDIYGDNPEIITPPNFWKQSPQVIGSPELNFLVKEYLKKAPEAFAKVNKIQEGPIEGVFNLLEASGFRPHEYEKTNLLGAYEPGSGSISLNPRLNPNFYKEPYDSIDRPVSLEGTLAHELSHARGLYHGRPLSNIEGLARMRADAKRLRKK